MAMIAWSDNLSVKVAEIDQQHQKLISMINELADAMKEGKGKDVIRNTVNGLVSYTVEHFKKEEMYFQKFQYADTDSHKKEHAAFIQKVSDFKNEVDEGKVSISVDVLNFLSSWLQNHIKLTDKKYSQLFNDNGLK